MSVITLTLNPAFDLHYTVDGFVPYGENYVSRAVVSAGGKGINVSRALNSFGAESRAVAVLGKENSAEFEKKLIEDGIRYIPVYTDGRIRENITVHSEGSPETRISLDTFSVDESVCDKAFDVAGAKKGDILVFSGRLPKGVEKAYFVKKLSKLSLSGVKTVLDSNSFTFDDIVAVRPWFVKPNEVEIKSLLGECDVKSALKTFVEAGTENVVISLGENGAVGYTDGKFVKLTVPHINAVSTVGAGDSTVAGIIYSCINGVGGTEMLRRGCSFGTAACLCDGTEPPKSNDADLIFGSITCEEF